MSVYADTDPPSGACSLLSPQGLTQIELLIGDSRFSNALRSLQPKVPNLTSLPYLEHGDTNHPLPPNHIIMECVNGKPHSGAKCGLPPAKQPCGHSMKKKLKPIPIDYFVTVNSGIRTFQEHDVRSALRTYFQGQTPADPGWRMAINAIIAHSLRKRNGMRNRDEYVKYIYNALGVLPNVIIRPPTPLTIGALLSTVSPRNAMRATLIPRSLVRG